MWSLWRPPQAREINGPECGFGRYEKTPWKVHHARTGESEPDRWCETCGRKLVHNIKLGWGDKTL